MKTTAPSLRRCATREIRHASSPSGPVVGDNMRGVQVVVLKTLHGSTIIERPSGGLTCLTSFSKCMNQSRLDESRTRRL